MQWRISYFHLNRCTWNKKIYFSCQMKNKSWRNTFPPLLNVKYLRVVTVILIHIRCSFHSSSFSKRSFEFFSSENCPFPLCFKMQWFIYDFQINQSTWNRKIYFQFHMKCKSIRHTFPPLLKVTYLRLVTLILILIRWSFHPPSELEHTFHFLSLENYLFHLYFEDAVTYFRFTNKSMHLKEKIYF